MTDLAGDSDCPICYLNYNRARRAPRRLQCGHALCTCCLGEMLLTCCHQLASPLACPFCRAPTSLDRMQQVTSLPLDLELWERLGAQPEEEEEELVCATPAPEENTTLSAEGLLHDDFRDVAMMTCYFL